MLNTEQPSYKSDLPTAPQEGVEQSSTPSSLNSDLEPSIGEFRDTTTPRELSEDQKILKEFNDSLNLFIKKITNFQGAKSQLKRVMTNLAVSPLNKEEFHWSYPEEKELFELGTIIASNKFMLLLSSLETQGKLVMIDPNKLEEKNES